MLSQAEICAQVRNNPKFHALVAKRNRYSFLLTVMVVVVYFGYILVIAFTPEFLANKIAPGFVTSFGIPLGLGVIVFTVVLTAIYVRRANNEFDTESRQLLRQVRRR
jgi:uncharacterized membrane protein (DUF485 family)